MKYVYAATNEEEFLQYRDFATKHNGRLQAYISFLKSSYQVCSFPGAVVFASSETASGLLSDIPIPAYTNEHRTMFCPDLSSWREIYLKQTDDPEIQSYYLSGLSENHILQILGHEFVHHSDLFIDEAFDRSRWFEEGICEYISRRYFLTDEEFEAEARINEMLVREFESKHGVLRLEEFCADTYAEGYESIFCFYWKSFLAVKQLTELFNCDLNAVFSEYRRWFETKTPMPLSLWMQL